MSIRRAVIVLAGTLLLAAPRIFAQDAPNTGPQAFYDENNDFYGPANNLYPPPLYPEGLPASPADSEGVSYAVNDGRYEPSVIVDFDEAVALGNAQNANSGIGAAPSLAEQAEAAVAAAKAQNTAAPASAQDDGGEQVTQGESAAGESAPSVP